MVPVEGKISEDASVQLLDELDVKALGVLGVGEKPVNVLHARLAVVQVVVCQLAQLWALLHLLETQLPSCISMPQYIHTVTLLISSSSRLHYILHPPVRSF
jgi:hypothetical protein